MRITRKIKKLVFVSEINLSLRRIIYNNTNIIKQKIMPDKNIYPNVQFPDFGALLESVKENGRITRIYQEGESKKGTDEHAAAARANSPSILEGVPLGGVVILNIRIPCEK